MNKNAFITRLLGAIFFLVISSPSFVSADTKLISTDDLYDLKEVSLVDLSKSGNEIIYSVSVINSKEDEYQSTLLLLNTCLLYTSDAADEGLGVSSSSCFGSDILTTRAAFLLLGDISKSRISPSIFVSCFFVLLDRLIAHS